jgi:hypothetical protein
MKCTVARLLCLVGSHTSFRGSRFHDWHCLFCGKFLHESVTYDNGYVPEGYTGLLYKAGDEDNLYRL